MRILFLLAALGLITAAVANADDAADRSAEAAFRRFLTAVAHHDIDAIKATMVPSDDAEILWAGNPPPKEVQEQIEKSLAGLKIVHIQEGETVKVPGLREFTLEKGAINDNKIFVWVEIDHQRLPTPFWMTKDGDDWKVNAGPLIAARKAAKAMQEKAKSGAPPQTP